MSSLSHLSYIHVFTAVSIEAKIWYFTRTFGGGNIVATHGKSDKVKKTKYKLDLKDVGRTPYVSHISLTEGGEIMLQLLGQFQRMSGLQLQ